MRITFLQASADMSGGARVIDIYATALYERGHDVCLVTRRPARASFLRRLRRLFLNGIPGKEARSRLSFSHHDNAKYKVIFVKSRQAINHNDVPDADIVIATWWETAEWMLKLPPEKGSKVHFVQHYEVFDWTPQQRVDQVLRTPCMKITISRWLEHMLVNKFNNHHVKMIPNAVDSVQFSAPPRGRQDNPTVGMVYSLTEWKDCRTGFEAIKILQQRLPSLQFVTFGLAPENKDLPMPDGTVHTVFPKQDDIRNIYSSCDVWLCSSLSEGFGLPLLEAMACRCPVISTAVGGPADFIQEGVNGFFVPVGDASKMADTLERFFSLPPSKWRSMSDAAHATAVAYSWEDAAKLFEQALYEARSLSVR